jgi:hypothetical protein
MMHAAEEIKNHIQDVSFSRSAVIAILGGGAGLVITMTVFFGLQRVFQELPIYQLLAAMQRSSTTLCFAGITSSATIMPLMLTIFSFARRAKVEFDNSFYRRIKWIAFLCSIAFFAALLTLTLLSAPLEDLSNVDIAWYRAIYYSVVGGLSSMVGLLVGIIIMLYFSILHIINRLNPHTLKKNGGGDSPEAEDDYSN